MKKYLLLPAMLVIASCGSNDDEVASGTFDDGDGGKGSFSVRGDGEDSETIIKSGDGEVRISSGSKASKDLPLGLELYPGADVQSSMTGSGDGKSGAMIVFTSKDDQEDVIKFYRKQMEAKGIEVKAEVKAGDMEMIGGEGLNVSVTKDGDGGVTATLIAGGDK